MTHKPKAEHEKFSSWRRTSASSNPDGINQFFLSIECYRASKCRPFEMLHRTKARRFHFEWNKGSKRPFVVRIGSVSMSSISSDCHFQLRMSHGTSQMSFHCCHPSMKNSNRFGENHREWGKWNRSKASNQVKCSIGKLMKLSSFGDSFSFPPIIFLAMKLLLPLRGVPGPFIICQMTEMVQHNFSNESFEDYRQTMRENS